MERLARLTRDLETPYAVVDGDTFARNADDLVRRAGGRADPGRQQVGAGPVDHRRGRCSATASRGVMSYSLAESCWLVDQGHDDILLAYPTVEPRGARATSSPTSAAAPRSPSWSTASSRSTSSTPPSAPTTRRSGCASTSTPRSSSARIHLGVRRSPVHSRDAGDRARRGHLAPRRGFDLVGRHVLRRADRRSARHLPRRPAGQDALRRRAARPPRHGSSRPSASTPTSRSSTPAAPAASRSPATTRTITELTAGSGLFSPRCSTATTPSSRAPRRSSCSRSSASRADDIATLFAGGYIASGAAKKNRQPTPAWPRGLALIGTEGAGEVQTPRQGQAPPASLRDRRPRRACGTPRPARCASASTRSSSLRRRRRATSTDAPDLPRRREELRMSPRPGTASTGRTGAAASSPPRRASRTRARPPRSSTIVRTRCRAGQQVKAVGAGHSFTADRRHRRRAAAARPAWRASCAPTRRPAGSACRPASRCTTSTRSSHALGLALPNLGDVDPQSVAGAISTGTHGTGGTALRHLRARSSACSWSRRDGDVLEIDEQHPLVRRGRRRRSAPSASSPR